MAKQEFKDRSSSPSGQGPYDAEENLPYLHKGEGRSEEHQDVLDRADAGLDDIDSVLAEQEAMKDGGQSPASEEEAAEAAALGGATGAGGWEDNTTEEEEDDSPKGILRGWKRKAAAGGAVAVGTGSIFAILSLSTGPIATLHFSAFLENTHFSDSQNFSDSRMGDLIRYARGLTGSERRNLGYFGNIIADRYTARLRDAGVEFGYNSNGRVDSITIRENDRTQRAISTLDEEGFNKTTSVVDGVTVHSYSLAGDGTYEAFRRRRSAIRSTVSILGAEGDANAMVARLMIRRSGVKFGVLNVPRTLDERLNQNIEEYVRKIRDEMAQYIREGRNASLETRAGTADEDATSPDDVDAQGQADAASEAAEEIIESADDGRPGVDSTALRTGIINNTVGVGGFAGLACGLKNLGDDVATVQTSNIVRPLIRNGMSVISLAAQIRFGGNINSDQIGALARSYYDQVTKTSWTDGASVRAEMGRSGGVPMDESAIPGTTKPVFFATLDRVLAAIPNSERVCGAVDSRVGSFVLNAADYLTGPFSALAGQLGQELLTRAFMDDFIRWVAGEQLDPLVQGAMFGNYANFGAFLANNDRMFSLGGRALTRQERAELKLQQVERERQEMKQKSLYARLFDLKEQKSLASKTLFENSTFASSQGMLRTFARAPTQIFSSLFGNLSTIAAPSASAIEGPVDYGVPKIGYSAGEAASRIAQENPYDNAEIVEARLDHLNDTYGDCFSTKINADTGEIETNEVTQYIGRNREKCDNPNNEELFRFRLYVGDMTIAQAAVCLTGEDEASCENLGFANEAPSADVAQLPDGVVTAEDIVDLQPWMKAGAGCHVSIADRLRQMFQAADADGVNLTGSCWRSSESQIELRKEHCGTSHYDIYEKPSGQCSPPTAIPGTSNHERGLAIDFDNCARGSACFNWLSANAATYGMKNLPSESWHWSVDGS